jgi:hypothetical protein
MKRIGILSLVLIVVLASIGIGYAMWSDKVTISGDVNTGILTVKIASQYDNDASNQNDPKVAGSWDFSGATPVWTGDRYTKNVASATSTYDTKDGRWAAIHITNGYPCYWGSSAWDVHNIGTIPVKLFKQQLVSLTLGITETTLATPMDVTIGTPYWVDLDTNTVDTNSFAGADIQFVLSAHGCDQIDPETWATGNLVGYLDMTIHVEQDAQQKATYGLKVDYTFCNWNE